MLMSNQLHPLYPKVTTLLDKFCLSQVVTGLTRESCSGRCSLHDLVLTMNPNILYNCSVIAPLAASDHLGVFSILNLYVPKLLEVIIILEKCDDTHMLIFLKLASGYLTQIGSHSFQMT